MTNKRNVTAGFPVRKQILGGLNKADVTVYIENIVTKVEAERRENEDRTQQYYDLMQNGQAYCDHTAAQAKLDANALMEETQQKVNALVQAAEKQLQQLRAERELLIEQTQTELRNLAGIVTQQQQQTSQAYETMLRPIMSLLDRLEGDDHDA